MADEQYLTVKEVAGLKDCGERHVQAQIKNGKIKGFEVFGLSTGQGGVQFRIPLSALPDNLRIKYKRLRRKQDKAALQRMSLEAAGPDIAVNFDNMSAAEWEEISSWKQLLSDWRRYRFISGLSTEEADNAFIEQCNAEIPGLNLTRRALYRKWKSFSVEGEAGLLDRRGKHGNHSKKLTPYIWDIFEYFYLDESRKSVTLCMTLTRLELEKQLRDGILPELPEIPAHSTFLREVSKIALPYVLYYRHGEEEYISKCEPHIKRMYDNLEPNDIWVADNHTLDVILQDGGKPLRLYLTVFMDVRTRKMMGWCVTDRPCADATLYALKKGIEKYGIPKMIYTDNGREFLFHDFGGNGFRRKKIAPGEFTPPSILKDLGIEFRTALPRNARAKGVERAFGTVKNTFSKLFDAYTGGNVTEKPGRLKEVVKNPDRLKTVEEFTAFVDTWIAGWYNRQPHSGEGMYGRTPDEVFSEMLIEQRLATEAQLNQLFMRWSNPMKVGKNGVTLTFYEKKLQYFEHNLWLNYFGKDVYVRYSPDNLREVRVYDMDQRYICMAALKEELGYDATKEEIAKNQQEARAASKAVKGYKKLKDIKTNDELTLILDKAAGNLAEGEVINPKFIRPIFAAEPLAKAVGFDFADEADEEIDWTTALQKFKERRDG